MVHIVHTILTAYSIFRCSLFIHKELYHIANLPVHNISFDGRAIIMLLHQHPLQV